MIKVTARQLLSLSIALFLISLPQPGHTQYVPGQILVRLHPSASKPTATTFGHLANQYGILSMEPLYETPIRRAKPAEIGRFSHLYRIRITGNPEEAAHAFSNAPNVIYAQPNHIFRPQQAPNDPRFSSQQNLTTIHWQTLADALGPVQKQITVAIIDSGIDYTHEDLAPNIWTNVQEANGQPGVDDDNNGYIDDIRGWDFTHAPDLPGRGDYLHPDNDPMDESGHGTHVAGIIGAEANNGLGIAGIAPNAQLMALRAGLSLQSGATFLEEDDLAAAILYAVDNGAHIINMSWGGPERSFLITDALHFASENGLLLIAAAGNSGEVGIVSPAARNITIAVGATDRNDRLASFSTIGASLDLTAPGVNILSTQPGNAYTSRSGSSFAVPHISGLSALLLSRFPDLTPQQIRTRLVNATADLGFPGWDFTFGAGRIDAAALAALTDPPPVVQILSPDSGDASHTAFDIVAKASGASLTTYRLSWGFGQIPQSWTVLQTGAPSEVITFRWPVDALQDTTLVLRLEADLVNGRTLE
ncbi:MAG: S8 family peptidase, partial [bacterium]|nr:S8 family peptidase [bacterium]